MYPLQSLSVHWTADSERGMSTQRPLTICVSERVFLTSSLFSSSKTRAGTRPLCDQRFDFELREQAFWVPSPVGLRWCGMRASPGWQAEHLDRQIPLDADDVVLAQLACSFGLELPRTTTTAPDAWAAQCWLTEPRTKLAKPPRPREPTTSSCASEAARRSSLAADP